MNTVERFFYTLFGGDNPPYPIDGLNVEQPGPTLHHPTTNKKTVTDFLLTLGENRLIIEVGDRIHNGHKHHQKSIAQACNEPYLQVSWNAMRHGDSFAAVILAALQHSLNLERAQQTIYQLEEKEVTPDED